MVIKKILILFGLALVLSACCTIKECIDTLDYIGIEFKYFPIGVLDTNIMIVSYEKGNTFNTVVDSGFLVSYNFNTSGNYSLNDIDFTDSYDYRIILNDSINFELTNIIVAPEECNRCFFTEDLYSKLQSYTVSGYVKKGSEIEIEFGAIPED